MGTALIGRGEVQWLIYRTDGFAPLDSLNSMLQAKSRSKNINI
jgi:hypothetical protein